MHKKDFLPWFLVDNSGVLWLNDNNTRKDVDGKFALFGGCREPAVGASRSGRIGRSDSRVDPANVRK